MENISKVTAVIFLISFLWSFISILLYKKKKAKMSVVFDILLSFTFILCYQCGVVAIIKLFNIPFYVVHVACADALLALVLTVTMIRKKSIQRLSMSRWDIVAIIVIFATTFYFGEWEFTKQLNIAYINSDPAIHFEFAMRALRDGTTTGMFFSEINNALFISVLAPFFENLVNAYKA
ncbi:MAG: hypothetical protein ACK5LC_09665, partial [Coprobacillaceae bacterium]